MRLGVKVGQGCTALMDAKMRNLSCTRLECDEIWGYIGKKDRHVRPDDDPQFGNVWTYCAIDADTKLVPTFRVAKTAMSKTTTAFMLDVADRMKNRVQISTDGLKAYVEAMDWAFGGNVDYGQIVKTYGTEESVEAQRRYSAPKITASRKEGDLRASRVRSDLDQLCGTPERHHAAAHEAAGPSHARLQQKAREL